MKDEKQGAISFTSREALHIGLGTHLSTAVAATGTRAEDATEQERLAISFWIWGLWNTGPNCIVNDLEVRMTEAVERGFNCFRIELYLIDETVYFRWKIP